MLIAASNGRLEVARYIAGRVPVSTIIYDSLYFTSLDDWFRIYFNWPMGEKILSPKTIATPREDAKIKVSD